MPLIRLSDQDAVANRKRNSAAGWGARGDASRVEPLAQPQFEVPFRLEVGDRIFTIGSCFARNVESELLRRGFAVPTRELFTRSDFSNFPVDIINNYGAPSIYNEIAWAFGEAPFKPDDHLIEVRPGKFADIHLSPGLRPEPWESVLERRSAIAEAYRSAASCTAAIMTLGLAELWFDRHTGCYVNVAPRPSIIARYPGRFELHVLSFQEAFDYLEKAILILRKHAPQIRFLLTVSPVPLMITHRPIDVMVANTYSKSLLRAVAETIVTKYDWVTYFPSYESVTLSDRKLAWQDDLIHVTSEMVAFNVSRMIEAFTDSKVEEDAPISDVVAAIERARAARSLGPQVAASFFERNREWSAKNREFAVEHARYLLLAGRGSEALSVLSKFDSSNLRVAVLMAQALTAVGRAFDAIELLEFHCTPQAKSAVLWDTLLSAAIATEDIEKTNVVLSRLRNAIPTKAAPSTIRAAKWFLSRGYKERSIVLAKAAGNDNLSNGLLLQLSELLIELGELVEADRMLNAVELPNGNERARIERLKAFIGPISAAEPVRSSPAPSAR